MPPFAGVLSDEQIAQIEKLVNDRIKANEPVYWTEVPFTEVQKQPAIQQFFGEKYGDTVRVLQMGGAAGSFDGFSMELCGGCHVRNTGDIGLFKVMRESAIAAGIRRIEAVCGKYAEQFIEEQKVFTKMHKHWTASTSNSWCRCRTRSATAGSPRSATCSVGSPSARPTISA
jgi:alanyl-tRNA synthetase